MSLTHENIKWNDDYCIGDKEIDMEYKKLFKIAQMALDIEKLHEDSQIISAIKKVIDELSFYVSTHFVVEQKYMRTIQYPRADQHASIHKSIVNDLNKFISNLNNLTLEEVKNQLFVLIKKDFIDHIIHEDNKIIKWENSLDSFEKTFHWEECFELGDETIDEENQKLFIMAQEAFHQATPEQLDKKIRLVVRYLYHYMKEHFRYEEALMHENEYPKLAKHLLMHRKIINQINHYVESLPTIKSKEDFEKGLAALMENTLIFHVMDQDSHFRQWYKENITVWN